MWKFMRFPKLMCQHIIKTTKSQRFQFYSCRGTFCNKGQKCENSSNLPLGSLEVFIYGDSSPKFQMYNEQKANGALTRENQNANNKSVKT